MANATDENIFKRLTFRFQGGKCGLLKATTGTEAVAAALTVTVALGTANKQTQEAQNAKQQQKAKKKEAKQAEEDADAGTNVEDEPEEGSELLSTPEEDLLTATQAMMAVHRPARRLQMVTRAQRRGTLSVLTLTAKRQQQAGPLERCSTPTPPVSSSAAWHTVALVAAGMARPRI